MLKTVESGVVRRSAAWLLLCGGSAWLGGCAYGELKQVLRAQVAAETSCGDVRIEESPMYQPGYKPGQYRVRGCGVDRTYDCPQKTGLVAYGDKVCTYVDTNAVPPAAPTPEPPVMTEPMDQPMDEPMDDPAGEPAADEGLDAPLE